MDEIIREHITKNELETERLGERVGAVVQSGDCLALYGEMGSGKTAFVRGLARGMGLGARVSSPTFTVVNEYEGALPLFHFDMYRIADADELYNIGWDDYVERHGVCAVEWSENVTAAFTGEELTIRFSKLGDSERRIEIGRNGV